VDNRTSFEVVYHFWSDRNGMFTVKVALPHDKPAIGTITDIVPAAILYEREVHDLFGIEFPGHPDMRRLLLNDEWPKDEHPLRKDWKMDEKKFYGGVRSSTGGEKAG
jgi:NADH-quinone oxidoreductase subunit C